MGHPQIASKSSSALPLRERIAKLVPKELAELGEGASHSAKPLPLTNYD
jgi:hypothetical protein